MSAHRRHSRRVPRDNTGALSRSAKKSRRELRRLWQSERSRNPVKQRYRTKRNNCINDSTISQTVDFFSVAFSNNPINFPFCITLKYRQTLVSYFTISVSGVVSTREKIFSWPHRCEWNHDGLAERLLACQTIYTPKTFAVHRTARDNTQKRTRFSMRDARGNGWDGICESGEPRAPCSKVPQTTSRYWCIPSNVRRRHIIFRYLRRLRVLSRVLFRENCYWVLSLLYETTRTIRTYVEGSAMSIYGLKITVKYPLSNSEYQDTRSTIRLYTHPWFSFIKTFHII